MGDEMESAIEEIERWCKAAFQSAAQLPVGSEERRFIEHGAMCYFNCVTLLERVQSASSTPP